MTEICGASGSSSSSDAQDLSLPELFDRCYQIYDNLQDNCSDTSSDEFKKLISKGIDYLEEAKRKVYTLGILSPNENLEEIATADLKYLLLPALLGSFTSKLHNEDRQTRKKALISTEGYYEEFMERLSDYGVLEDPESQHNIHERLGLNDQYAVPKDLGHSAKLREIKIRRYKKGKELKTKISDLKHVMSIDKDEEVHRQYYMLLLQKFILEVEDDLEQIELEKKVLNHEPKLPDQSEKVNKKAQGIQPVILTRNDLQKRVFGAGYPSIPVMSVNEFYEQRFLHGEKAEPPISQMDNLKLRSSACDEHYQVSEDEEKEKKIENDEPECLQYARDFDDWKDYNRRGCGNRKNMG